MRFDSCPAASGTNHDECDTMKFCPKCATRNADEARRPWYFRVWGKLRTFLHEWRCSDHGKSASKDSMSADLNAREYAPTSGKTDQPAITVPESIPSAPTSPICENAIGGDPKRDNQESSIFSWPVVDDNDSGIPADVRDFLRDRLGLGELNPNKRQCDDKWALATVDFLDELSIVSNDCPERARQALDRIKASVISALVDKGYSLLDDDGWNPDAQRAVAVVRRNDVESPKVIGKGATGLSQNGRVIRKQEVKLLVKG